MKINFNLIVFLIAIPLLFACKEEQPMDIEQEDEIFTEFKERDQFMESERVAFLTRQLELTPDEAELFWPVFNQYIDIKNDLWEQHKLLLHNTRRYQSLTDQIAKETLDSLFSTQEAILANEKHLTSELLKTLSPQKVLKIQHAEHRFKRHLLRQVRGGRRQRGR
ncbi:MAG: hypothetical protein PHU27_05085 [Salinivirgaceae bacterium]|nr:hypothetical protein [Salinivirgaceae bacterium]MDD4746794.1 hypothetical protein [Salinivirgaceae bacterium]MDY0282292.1 hypothetical protein [Salinivirgaceae bacterium]